MPKLFLALGILVAGCGPLKCQELAVGIYPLEGKPKPAGRLLLKCDGKAVLEAHAATVTTGAR